MAYHTFGVNTFIHMLCLLVDLDFLYTSCVKLSHKDIVPRIHAYAPWIAETTNKAEKVTALIYNVDTVHNVRYQYATPVVCRDVVGTKQPLCRRRRTCVSEPATLTTTTALDRLSATQMSRSFCSHRRIWCINDQTNKVVYPGRPMEYFVSLCSPQNARLLFVHNHHCPL